MRFILIGLAVFALGWAHRLACRRAYKAGYDRGLEAAYRMFGK